MIEIPKDVFMEAAENADFDDIRTGYNGRGYATNSIGLIGAQEQLLKFFAELGAVTMKADAPIGLDKVSRLADGMGTDNMGRSDLIFYWSENVLKLTEDDE